MRREFAPGPNGELRALTSAEILERGKRMARRSTRERATEIRRQREARDRRKAQADRIRRVGLLRRVGAKGLADVYAVHEAGHTLLGVIDGAGVAFVEFEFTERGHDVDLAAAIYWPRDVDKITARTLLAGSIAAEMAGFSVPRSWSRKDEEMARETGEDLDRARAEARALLSKYWPAVEAVAAELRRFGYVSGPHAEALIFASGVPA